MIAASARVVLDANVLYPFTLRDTLLRAAGEGYFRVSWSDRILDEAMRNLVADALVTAEQAARLRAAMTGAFPEALVTGYDALIPSMKNDPKDRHVAAAALKAGAQIIVTLNIKDFSKLPDGIEALGPDEFLRTLFDRDPIGMVSIVRQQAAELRRPPRSFEDVVGALQKVVPRFAGRLRAAS
jgi:predicted nucleic acid-binding protein